MVARGTLRRGGFALQHGDLPAAGRQPFGGNRLSGTGAKAGTKPKACSMCGGAGRVRQARALGRFQSSPGRSGCRYMCAGGGSG